MSIVDSGFITEMKDKNGDSWYHQIVLETAQEENKRLNKNIKELEILVECLYLKVTLNQEQEELLNKIIGGVIKSEFK